MISSLPLDSFFVARDKKDLQRIKNLIFHIESDDYFATLATILDLMRQRMEQAKQSSDRCSENLEELKNDLVYLQKNYKIIKK